jgi:hypothetical protein
VAVLCSLDKEAAATPTWDTLNGFITEQRLTDLFIFNPQPDNDFLGFDKNVLAQHLSPAIILADILVEVDHVLRVVGHQGALDRLRDE